LQLGIIGIGAAFVFFVFVGVPAVESHFAATNAKQHEEPLPDGAFRATPTQWNTLTFTQVKPAAFRSYDDTDGKIAIDDDTTTPVFSQYSGKVVKIFAKAGDAVKAGAPLLAVEATEFVQGQNDLITAKASLTTAEAQLRLAQIAEKRQHDLFDAKGGALKDWQQSQVDLANAEGTYRTAEIALESVRNRLRILGKSDGEIKDLESAKTRSAMTPVATVRAPIGGTVIQRQVGLGEYINSGANSGTQIFSIGNLSTVWLVAKVRETAAPLMKIGQPLDVKVLAYPDKTFNAHVTYVAPSIDPDTRRLTVRAEVENSDQTLKPEMFASFQIITGTEATSLAVPDESVIYEGAKSHVWVAGTGNYLSLREITVGRHSGGLTEVTSGLNDGETIVVKGPLFIDRASKTD
jgi:cobalt-zinc-cadmium efflux system membrane fusion protein